MFITLTEDQQNAFSLVKTMLADDTIPAVTIKGSAGTGKTTLTKYIADFISTQTPLKIIAIAPTHKAKRVLSSMLNSTRFMSITCHTLASVLGKAPMHSYIGSSNFSGKSTQKLDTYDVIMIDEVSMISDSDIDTILNYACETERKVIMIGDDCQIPCPSQKLEKIGQNCCKPNSTAFDLIEIYTLTKIVRQAEGSPIITIATHIRDNINVELSLEQIISETGVPLSTFSIKQSELYEKFKIDIQNGLDARIIAYTNASVRSHNIRARLALGYKNNIEEGELLTGYKQVGYPDIYIENGTDYIVSNIHGAMKWVDDFRLTGKTITLTDISDKTHIERDVFFIDINNAGNVDFMIEFVKRAEKVNQPRSRTDDYRNYMKLKNKVVFLENIYKYKDHIISEHDFKTNHPLLFTHTTEVIDVKENGIYDTEITKKILNQYNEILDERLYDNKLISDSELLSDRYMIVSKDITYGYSITAHKTQGSTYDNVYVDDKDFKKVVCKWNYRLNAMENRHTERNQLRYVSYTRASRKLFILN
jgi:hypothetical protein